jgi:CubicO group peptidase (beta-lactamase class C family)
MEHPPGTAFEYNTGTSNMFAAIIGEATMMPLDSFAQNYLFEPLGITDFYWNRDPQGHPCAGGSRGGVMLRPRDMAKFGYLYLSGGVWNGVQVISSAWICESTTKYVNVNFLGSCGYGYQWWLAAFDVGVGSIEAFYGMGYGGQYIFVIEELDMVVVFAGGGNGNVYAYTQVFEMMNEYILPAADPRITSAIAN